ncbi:hypothetical protein HPP92_028066 [Vanilla planifolia]|uniref:UBX domain-containing protein n=1 Tax=Vanilla planifolia TaxID=51239 RepID=A0A835U400_VANPL|nr:hypothetical protein HPP92_028066 [Vanilla planifolia]KAG0448042.1 hypothetical protein HPP92_028037 [Vanilla planifolia]
MDEESAKAKFFSVVHELGHEIRVFTNAAISGSSNEASSPPKDEPDDFYDFTPEDYYRIVANKLGAQSQILKTSKMREAEAAARRARITKAIIRVRFPDNYILEAKFQPSQTIQTLVDLLMKSIARPDLPFYLYTTPPKEPIKDLSKDFYSAGFAPGAIVYFSYDLAKDSEHSFPNTGPFLRDEILSLNGLDFSHETVEPVRNEQKSVITEGSHDISEAMQPVKKKPTKPKWLKL